MFQSLLQFKRSHRLGEIVVHAQGKAQFAVAPVPISGRSCRVFRFSLIGPVLVGGFCRLDGKMESRTFSHIPRDRARSAVHRRFRSASACPAPVFSSPPILLSRSGSLGHHPKRDKVATCGGDTRRIGTIRPETRARKRRVRARC
jgi:hypothetical protein